VRSKESARIRSEMPSRDRARVVSAPEGNALRRVSEITGNLI